jgi:apolipoprotein N-acyltransferase
MPLLWLEVESRRGAFLVPMAFYLSISRGIVPGAYVFFRDGSLVRALTLWILSGTALALPWGVLWSDKRKQNGWRAILVLLISIPPPLGLIGWGNPLTAVGLFFLGWSWWGLALTLDLYAEAALSAKLRRALIAFVFIAAPVLTLPSLPERVTVGGLTIQGIDTSFGRVASGSGNFDEQYQRERLVFQHIQEKQRDGGLESASVVVLPETIIGRINPTTLKRWTKFFEPFTQDGAVFIAGGEIPTDQCRKYDNAMVSFEADGKRKIAKQRFPVPFSMFRPFSGHGANAYLASLGEVSIMEVNGKRLGFLVCYEQFLSWPVLTLVSQRPDVFIAPSNLWWCEGTSLPGIRGAAVRMWGRLFGVPLVSVVNQ